MCFLEPECLTPDPSQAVMHSRWSCWLAAQSDLRNILHSLAVQKTRKMGIVIRCGDEASSPPQTVWIQAGAARHDRTETVCILCSRMAWNGRHPTAWTPRVPKTVDDINPALPIKRNIP